MAIILNADDMEFEAIQNMLSFYKCHSEHSLSSLTSVLRYSNLNFCRFFARFMSKNEDIRKAKLLMQQNLSHGAPSPKLSKMLEVLLDHFSM